MPLTRNALGNLINRYKAVLGKCRLLNTFGSLAVVAALTMGGTGAAWADTTVDWSDKEGDGVVIDGDAWVSDPIKETMRISSLTIGKDGELEIAQGGGLTAGSIIIDGRLDITADNAQITAPYVSIDTECAGTGQVSVSGSLTFNSLGGGEADQSVSQNGLVSIDQGGSLTIGSNITYYLEKSGSLNNGGTLTADAGSELVGEGKLQNNGTLNIREGASFNLSGGELTNNGTLNIDGAVQLDGTIHQSSAGSVVNITSSLAVTGGQFDALRKGAIVIGGDKTDGAALHTGNGVANSVAFSDSEFGNAIRFEGQNSRIEVWDGYDTFGHVTINGTGGKDALNLSGGAIKAESFVLNPDSGAMTLQNGTLHAMGLTDGAVTINGTGDQSTGIVNISENGRLLLGDVFISEGYGQEIPAQGGTVTDDIAVTGNGALAIQAGQWKVGGTISLDSPDSTLAIGGLEKAHTQLTIKGGMDVTNGNVAIKKGSGLVIAEGAGFTQAAGTLTNDASITIHGKVSIDDKVLVNGNGVDGRPTGTISVLNTNARGDSGDDKGILEVAGSTFAALWEKGKLLIGLDGQGDTAYGTTRVDVKGDATIDDVAKFVATEDLGEDKLPENGKVTMGDYAHLNVSGTLTIKESGELKTGNQGGGDEEQGSFTAHAMSVADNLTLVGNVFIDGKPGQGVGGAIAPMESGIVVADSGSLTVDGRLTLGSTPWEDGNDGDTGRKGGRIDGSLVLGPKRERELVVAARERELVVAAGEWTITGDTEVQAKGTVSVNDGADLTVGGTMALTDGSTLRVDEKASFTTKNLDIGSSSMVVSGNATASGATSLDGGTITIASAGTLSLRGTASTSDKGGTVYVGDAHYPVAESGEPSNGNLELARSQLGGLLEHGSVVLQGTDAADSTSTLTLTDKDAVSLDVSQISNREKHGAVAMDANSVLKAGSITFTDSTATEASGPTQLNIDETATIRVNSAVELTDKMEFVSGTLNLVGNGNTTGEAVREALSGAELKVVGGNLQLGEKDTAGTGGIIATTVHVADGSANVASGDWTLARNGRIEVQGGSFTISGSKSAPSSLTVAQGGILRSEETGDGVVGINVLAHGMLKADKSTLMQEQEDLSGPVRADGLAQIYLARGGVLSITGTATTADGTMTKADRAWYTASDTGILASDSQGLVEYDAELDQVDRTDKGNLVGPDWDGTHDLRRNDTMEYAATDPVIGNYGAAAILINTGTSTDTIDTLRIGEDVTLLGNAADRLISAETEALDNPTQVAISAVEIANNKKLSLGLATEGTDAGYGTLESDVLLNEGSGIGAVNGDYTVKDIKAAEDGKGTVSAGKGGSLSAKKIGEDGKAVGVVEAADGGEASSQSTIDAKNITATNGYVTAKNAIHAVSISATGGNGLVDGESIDAGTITADAATVVGGSVSASTVNLANGGTVSATNGDLVVDNRVDNDGGHKANGNLSAENGNILLKQGAHSDTLALRAKDADDADRGKIVFFEDGNDTASSSKVQSAVADNAVIVNGTNKTVTFNDELRGNLKAGANAVTVGAGAASTLPAAIGLTGESKAGSLVLDNATGSTGDKITADTIGIDHGANVKGTEIVANTITADKASELAADRIIANKTAPDDGSAARIDKIAAAGGSTITASGNPIYATFISATGENSLVSSGYAVDATTIAADAGTVRGESVSAAAANLANGGRVTATNGDLVVSSTVANGNGALTLADNNANMIELQNGATSPDLDVTAKDGTVVIGGAGVDSKVKSLTAETLDVNGKSLAVTKGVKADTINLGDDTASKITQLVADTVNAVLVDLKDSALTAYTSLTGQLVDDDGEKSSVTVGNGSTPATVNLVGDNYMGTLRLNKVTEGSLGDSITAQHVTAQNGTSLDSGDTKIFVQTGDENNPGTLTVDNSTLSVNDVTADKVVASNGGSLTGNAIQATWLNADGQQSAIVGNGNVDAATVTADAGTISGARVNAATVNLANGGTVTATNGDLIIANTVAKGNGSLTLAANNTGKMDLQGGATSTDLKVTAANGTIAFGDSAVDSKAASVAAKTLDINGKSLTATNVAANRVNASNDGLVVTRQLATDTLQGKLTVAGGAKAFIRNPGAMDDNKTMTVSNATISVSPGGQVALGYDVTAPNAENHFVQDMKASMGRAADKAGAAPSAVLYLDRPTAVADTGSIGVGTSASAGNVAFADNSLLVVNGDNGSATTPYLTASGTISGLDKASLDVQRMKAGQEIRLLADGVARSSDFADGRNVTTDNRLVSASYQNGMITTAQVQAQQALPGLDGKLAALIDASGGQIGPEHVNSPQGGVKFLSRAVSRGYGYDNPGEAAKAVEGAARTLAVAAVPQMAMGANTAGANAVTQRTSLTAPASPLQSMNASGEVSGLNSGDETGLSAGNDYKSGFGMWIMPLWQSSNGFGLKAGNYKMDYSGNVAGVAIGADYTVADTVRAGVTFNIGGGHSSGSGDFGETTNNMNFWGVGAYVGMMADELGLTADVNYTSSFNDIKQELPSSFAMGNLNGEVRSSAISAGLRAEYKIETEAVDIIPHVAARYTALHSDDFSMKSGGQAVMKTKATDQNIWSFPVGVTFAKTIDTGNGWYVKPSLDLTVTPTTGDVDNRQKIQFTGVANKATMESQVMDRVTYGGQAGLEFGNDAIQLGLNYNLQVGEHTTNHGVFGTFRYNF